MPQDNSCQNKRGRSFRGKNLAGANFRGADIRGADFSGERSRWWIPASAIGWTGIALTITILT